MMPASPRYAINGFKRFFLGNTYRDLWTTPVRAPVLDLETYAGGLKPLKEGGGNQTKNLRLGAADGSEFVFRPVDKDNATPPERLQGTAIAKIFRDQVSGLFPAAGVIVAPIVEAAGVLHMTPAFAVLPNDSSLGKFRKDFIDRLGTVEEYPNKPEEGPGFAGAADIIDTEKLLPLLDSMPSDSVDSRAFLAARLFDMLVDDTDRHFGNWKWARFGPSKAARWVPIARDRDHAFNNYDGILAQDRVGEGAEPVDVRGKVPEHRGAFGQFAKLDRRFLADLEKPVWDSVAARSRAASPIASSTRPFVSCLRRIQDALRRRSPRSSSSAAMDCRPSPTSSTRRSREEIEVHATDVRRSGDRHLSGGWHRGRRSAVRKGGAVLPSTLRPA